MADQKADYPKMPERQWWALRDRFKQSIPGTVTATYLATVLGMEEISAGKNVLPALKRIGLVDQEGKPQERARRWRDDDEYPKVCEEIRKEVYPAELLEAVPDPNSNRAAAERWFRRTGAGASLVGKRVAFYQLLSAADPSKGQEKTRASSTGNTSGKRPRVIPPKSSRLAPTAAQGATPSPATQEATKIPEPTHGATESSKTQDDVRRPEAPQGPQLHIDIQIHISPDASPDQIDQIFASMAKHLYRRGLMNE